MNGPHRRGAREAAASAAQERLWLIETTAPGATYNVPIFTVWRDPIDVSVLAAALAAVVARHEILRTTYALRGERLNQIVGDPFDPGVDVVDARGRTAAWVRADAERRGCAPFDLATGPVLRSTVWRGADGGDALLLTVHHIAVDGWSLGPLFADLAAAYDRALRGESPDLGAPAVQYADFAAWDREQQDTPETAERVLVRAAALAPAADELILDGCRGARPAPEGARPGRQITFPVSADLADEVVRLARSVRATPFVVLIAAAQAALCKRSGRGEFLIGAVTANRTHPVLESVIGFFAATVPLYCRVHPDWSFADLVKDTRGETFRSLGYQRLPYDRLTRAVAAERGEGRKAVVNVGFVHQTVDEDVAGARWAPPIELPTGTAKFDLLFILDETTGGTAITIEYDSDRYAEPAVRDLGAALVTALESAVRTPGRPLRDYLGDGRAITAGPNPEKPGVAGSERETAGAPRSPEMPRAERSDGPAADAVRRAVALFGRALEDGGDAVGNTIPWLRPESDFFVLGGNSLLAVSMLAEAKRRYGVEVPPRVFLADPTVSGLARLLAAADPDPRDGRSAPGAVTDPASGVAMGNGPYRATSAQQRFWMIDRMPGMGVAYLSPVLVEYAGEVDRDALRRAVDTVLARHPALRSRFALDRKARRVTYRTDGPPATATVTDATGYDRAGLAAHLTAVLTEPFALDRDAPVRAEVIALGEGITLLALVPHHIVVDGRSQDVLLDQIARAYRAETGPGGEPRLPAPVHPATVSEPAGDVAAVVDRLRGAPVDVRLPHDHDRPAVQATEARCRTVALGLDRYARIRRTAVDELGCTPFTVVAALYAVALARRSGQRDLLFAFPWSGRETADSADAVGMFVNTLVLRAWMDDDPDWRTLLARVRDDARAAYGESSAPYDAVVAELHPGRDLSRPPLTPVYLTVVDGPRRPPSLAGGVTARFRPGECAHVKYELELEAEALPGDLNLTLFYATGLFRDETAAALLDDVVAAADSLATDPDSHPCSRTQGDRSGS